MLNGPLAGKIVLFAIPLALSSILQQLFNSADSVFAGQYLGSAALAAVGGVAPIISLFVATFTGLSVGVNVVIAIHIGHHDLGRIRGAIQTAAVAAIVCSIVMSVLGVALTDFILGAISMPQEAWQPAALYLHVYFIGIIFLVVYNFASAVLRAKGDTRRPLYALGVAAFLNIALDWIAVDPLSAGVLGIAVATVISDAVAAIIVVVLLLREEETYRLTFKDMKIVGADLKSMLHIGVPTALQGALFSVSNLVIQGGINGFGAAATAGNAAAVNYEFYTYFFTNAFSQAAVTFIGQNYAAHKYDRCDKVVKFCFAAAVGCTLVLGVTFTLAGNMALSLFTTDATAISFGLIRLWRVELLEFMPCTYEITAGAMRGMGWSVLPTVVVIFLTCILRIVYVIWIFPFMQTFENLMLIYPITWIATGATMIALFFFARKRAYTTHAG